MGSISFQNQETARSHLGESCVALIAASGFSFRNYLLRGGFTSAVESKRILVISPYAEDPSFKVQMKMGGFSAALLENPDVDPRWQRLRAWRNRFHYAKLRTNTIQLKRDSSSATTSFKKKLADGLSTLLPSSIVLKYLDRCEQKRSIYGPEADYYRKLFIRENVSVVFAPSAVFVEEWLPVFVAQSMGIKTVLGILSWDNLSSKGRLPVPASHYVVWSQSMKDELLEIYPDISSEQISITGTPQFDFYFDESFFETRDRFCRRFSFQPDRPVLVYAGVTPTLMPEEPRIVRRLAEMVFNGQISGYPQLLLRLHPKDSGERWMDLVKDFPQMAFVCPGQRNQGQLQKWIPKQEDMSLLVNTIRHGDVHLNVASTMTLDAAILNRPIVNIGFDLGPSRSKPWGLSIYECTHFRPVIAARGTQLVKDPEEMRMAIIHYLQDPYRDSHGRQRIVDLVCGQLDGKSAERVGKVIRSV